MRHVESGSRAFAVAVVVLGSALVAGCGQGVSSRARWGSVHASALVPAAPAPLDIEVLSPAPAAWLATPDVTVEGVVRRPAPAQVAQVSVGGVPATVDAAGRFRAPVHLDAGVASVVVLVTDTRGEVTATTASYLVGALRPLADPVRDALTARVDASAFPRLSGLVGDGLDRIDFDALLVPLSPIPLASALGGAVQVELDIVSTRHGPWTASVAPQAGTLAVTAEVSDVHVRVLLHLPGGSLIPVSVPGEVAALRARATTTARLVTHPGASATVDVAPPALDLQGTTFTVQGPVSGPVASAALALAQAELTRVVAERLAFVLGRDLPRILGAQLGLVGAPTASVQGVAFTFSASPTRLDVGPSGVVLAVDADLTAPIAPGRVAAPGVLADAGPPPALGPGREAAVALSPGLLARATTVAWQAGALDLDIDAAAWAGLGATLPPLDVQGFSQLVPELARVLPASTPLVLRLRPGLPPRLVVAPGPSLVTLEVGELHLEVWADLPGGRVPALDLTVHARVPLEATVANGALGLALGPRRPRWLFSVAAQPLVRVDALAVQTRLTVVLDALLPGLLAGTTVALPVIGTRGVTNVVLSAGGPLGDHLVVAGDL